MARISYLNGEFLEHDKCFIHIEDRGFQFADGAYEVTLFDNGKLVDGDFHIERFFRSLRELKIEHNFTADYLEELQLELFAQNNLDAGTCYIQITRGVAKRVPNFPKNINATISATISPRKKMSDEDFARGVSLMSHDDIRWQRCDIKSIALFASSMMNQKAKDEGFDDAVLVRDGFVTEGSFANIFIVDVDENLITHPVDNMILQGITRNRIIQIAQDKGINVEERKFTLDEMLRAKEVFLTSSSLLVRPASKVDGKLIDDGENRKIATILRDAYVEFVDN
jgi:D-alanine transaminase